MNRTPEQVVEDIVPDIIDAAVSLKSQYATTHIKALMLDAIREIVAPLHAARADLIAENETLTRYAGNQIFMSDFQTADDMRAALVEAQNQLRKFELEEAVEEAVHCL